MPRMGLKGDGGASAKRLLPADAPGCEPLSGLRTAEQIAATPPAMVRAGHRFLLARKAGAAVAMEG